MTTPPALLRRIIDRLFTERDIWKWRRQLSRLRAASAPESNRTVLFCNLMTMPSTAKVEALMAGLLRLKGYRAVVLLEDRYRPIEEIFRAAAPDVEFIYLNPAINGAAAEDARRAATAIMGRAHSLQELVALEVDGFRIGRNVQSLVLRKFRVGRLDDADPSHRDTALATLARSLATKAFVERELAKRAPDIAVFIERGYTPAGEVFDGCLLRGVDTFQWCGAPQSDCLIYRRYSLASRGEHPLTLSTSTWQKLLAMPWSPDNAQVVTKRITSNYASGAWYNRQQLQAGKAITTADEVRRTLGLDPSKKTAVIFSHILYDATFFYGESLFEDYEQWLVETVRSAIANPRLNWVVKVHPVNVWRARMDGVEPVQLEAQSLKMHFGKLPPHVTLMPADTSVNTFSLFSVADYGLTVRGTIGMELPCFGIPVVTAGTGRYSGRGFTIDPATVDEYRTVLENLHDVPRLSDEATRLARLYYYGTLHLMPMPMRSFVLDFFARKASSGVFEPDVVLNTSAGANLLHTEDLGRLIHWMTASNAPELLVRDI